MITKNASAPGFPTKPSLNSRPLISVSEALEVAALFKTLASDTRLRLLHALTKSEEICVTDLADTVEMKPQAVSNQLQRLVDRGILATRRNGNQIYYRIVDACVPTLLDKGLCLIEDSKMMKRKSNVKVS